MVKYLVVLFLLISVQTPCQIKVYYNSQGEITIPEIASHYRVATIDPIQKKFKGKVVEFDINHKPFLELNYDSVGVKNGYFKYHRYGHSLEGEFDNNTPNVSIPDSILELITRKEQFVQSAYIRKNDYLEIKNILSPLAQSSDNIVVNGQVFTVVEDNPVFPGGMTAVGKFLSYNLVYPKAAKDGGVTGRVFVQFVVNRDGTIDKVKVIKGIGSGCDESAIFAVSKLPDWKPGYQNGEPVPVQMVLPVRFQ